MALPDLRGGLRGGSPGDASVGRDALPGLQVPARAKRGEAPCGFCGHPRRDHPTPMLGKYAESCLGCARIHMSNAAHRFRRARPITHSGYHDRRRK